MAGTLYRWDDANAPVLNTTAGSMIALLKAVLVDGYGSKSPLGWSNEFEDAPNNKIVLRPGAGNRFFYRFQDNQIYYCECIGYETMADIDNGSGPWPTASIGAAQMRFEKSSTTNVSSWMPWIIWGDAAGFYLFVYTNLYSTAPGGTGSYDRAKTYYFGDGVTWIPGDSYFSLLIGGQAAVNYSTFGYLSGYNSPHTTGYWVCRNSDNVAGAKAIATLFGPFVNTNSGQYGLDYPAGNHDAVLHFPFYLNDSAANTFRGKLTDSVYIMPYSYQQFENLQVIDTVLLVIRLYMGSSGYGLVLINTSENLR